MLDLTKNPYSKEWLAENELSYRDGIKEAIDAAKPHMKAAKDAADAVKKKYEKELKGQQKSEIGWAINESLRNLASNLWGR